MNKHYQDIKTFRIFALLLEAEAQYIFVGRTAGQRLSAVFWRHISGEIDATAGYFDKEERRPRMYVLEELQSSIGGIHKHVVAWCHIFRSAGYVCINHDGTVRQSENLLPETQALVQQLSAEPLEQILQRTYLAHPADGDRKAEASEEPEEAGEKTAQMNVRMTQRDKDRFGRFCKARKLNQREGFGLLLDYAETDDDAKNIRAILKDRDRKITALEAENQKLSQKLKTLQPGAKSEKEIRAEKQLAFLNSGILEYLQLLFPEKEDKHSLKETSYRRYVRGLSWQDKPQYPAEAGFMVWQPEAILWGDPLHRACFLTGTGPDGKTYKLRCYPKKEFSGFWPRDSGYAVPESCWLVGYQPAKDGAMELVAAYPIPQQESPQPEQEAQSPIPEAVPKKNTLDMQIRRAESKCQ